MIVDEVFMNEKNIVLFDMDGTLTPARESAGVPIAMAMRELSRVAKIGIVTGSHFEYLQQQCESILNSLVGPQLDRVSLFPCNGGQYYRWSGSSWHLLGDKNMQNFLGQQKFNELMKTCIFVLNAAVEDLDTESWGMAGHFVEYRGPMINLCFPGRQAEKSDRKKFQDLDKKYNIRNSALNRLKGKMIVDDICDLECKLGGNTSIDIFPKGWNKLLALENIAEPQVWFVGDRCTGDGNDREIYEYTMKYDRGYETDGPGQTVDIIENIIQKIKENKDQ